MTPDKLKLGDEIRVIAPSRSLAVVRADSPSPEARLEDLHEAFADPGGRGVVPAGIPVGFGADFGHVFPMLMFPIGGRVRVETGDSVRITLQAH